MKPRQRRRGGRGRGGRSNQASPPARPASVWTWLRGLLGTRPETTQRQLPAGAAPSDTEAKLFAEFGKQFQIDFQRPDLLKLALTHRSYLSVTGQSARESNERLEFLGDSVLGLVTSEYLYREHPGEHEGQLTKTKSLLVSKAILSRRALAMGLGKYVLMSRSESDSGGRQRLSILADAFEAVVGAIYLDQGFEAARQFILRWLLRDSREIVADKRHTNYKSHLQEFVQSTYRTHPVYRIRSEVGPDHSKQFNVEVLVGRRVLGTGRGRNKKDAEQAAARDALAQSEGRKSDEAQRSVRERSGRGEREGGRGEREGGRGEREGGRGEREGVRGEREGGRGEREGGRGERESERGEREGGRGEREGGRGERGIETPHATREPATAERTEANRAVPARDDDDDERGPRRRGRRGGRGRRGRREGGEPASGEEARETSRAAEPVRPRTEPPRESSRDLPRPGRDMGRGGRRDRDAAPEQPSTPLASMTRPAGSAGLFGGLAEDGEEIGRPEGPLDDRRVDPFAWDETPAPPDSRPPRDEGHYVGGRTVGRLGGWMSAPSTPVREEEEPQDQGGEPPEPVEPVGTAETTERREEEPASGEPRASQTSSGEASQGPSFGRRRSRR